MRGSISFSSLKQQMGKRGKLAAGRHPFCKEGYLEANAGTVCSPLLSAVQKPACLRSPGTWQPLGQSFELRAAASAMSAQPGCSERQQSAFVTKLHFLSINSLNGSIVCIEGKNGF